MSDIYNREQKKDYFNAEAQAIARQEYQKKSRDNARTPVQWSDAENAGFTGPGVKPWMSVNPDYVRVNAAAEVKDPNSTYHFWASVLGLRKKYLDIFVYGNWVQIDAPSEEVFAFTRKYEDQKALIVCNFTANTLDWNAGSNGVAATKEVLLNNYESATEAAQRFSGDKWSLRPYEAAVLLL